MPPQEAGQFAAGDAGDDLGHRGEGTRGQRELEARDTEQSDEGAEWHVDRIPGELTTPRSQGTNSN